MSDKLINAVIQIASKEEKSGKFGPIVKIKDEKGLTFTVYKTKKDGTVSVAWEQLQTLLVGDMVQVSFSEEIVDHPEHGKYTARTIRAFNPDIGANSSASKESSNLGHSGASQRGSSDAFGRRLGVQGHINALLSNPEVYYHSVGKDIVRIDALVKLAIEIEDEAEKQLSPASLERANLTNELPTIQVNEDLGQDIPF